MCRRMVEYLMNKELDKTWKKELVSYLYFLSRHLLAGTNNFSHGSQGPD